MTLLVAAAVVTPSSASALPEKERLSPAIVRLEDGHPDVNMLPAHLPVPATSTGIGPGSQLLMDRPDGSFVCTANFIWTKTTTTYPSKKNGKPDGKHPIVTKTTYLGAAGHCFLPEGKVSTHGQGADYDPGLTAVSVCVNACEFGGQGGPVFGDFLPLGPVAFARQTKRGEAFGNDFGIVEIPSTVPKSQLRPQVPVWEGPSGIEDVSLGGQVCLYGNATVFGEVFPTKARSGIGEGIDPTGHAWKAFIPSAPGDSGSALVTCGDDGSGLHGFGAAGILTHIGGTQETARIVGTTTARAAEMTEQDTGMDLRLMLEDGTEVDTPTLAPVPEPAPITPDVVHPVDVGGSYSWTAGPFTRTAPPESVFFGDDCSGVEPASEHCDYEFVRLNVPAGGASLQATVSTDDVNADFDLFVFKPDGDLLDSSLSAGTPPEVVTAVVTEAGTYTIAVDPYDASGASYAGAVELSPPPPPPAEVFDGEISMGSSYSWSGDPVLDANPGFTCADPVNAFCDDELIKVNVPTGGAMLTVDITADIAGDDFDLCVYSPSGTQTCVSETGNEHLELPVAATGIYRVGVKAFLATGTYSGSATLG
jgi:hypothetical protein